MKCLFSNYVKVEIKYLDMLFAFFFVKKIILHKYLPHFYEPNLIYLPNF